MLPVIFCEFREARKRDQVVAGRADARGRLEEREGLQHKHCSAESVAPPEKTMEE